MIVTRLLIPEPGGNLYIAGCPSILQFIPNDGWEMISIVEQDVVSPTGIPKHHSQNTILVTDWSIYQKYRDLLPAGILVYLGRYRAAITKLPSDYVRLSAYPLLGKPLVWCHGNQCNMYEVYPRGRIDILILKMHQWFLRFNIQKLANTIVFHSKHSILSRLMHHAGMEYQSCYQTKTKQLIMMNDQYVLKIPMEATDTDDKQYKEIEQLRTTFADNPILSYIPNPGRKIKIGNQTAFIEQRIHGNSALSAVGQRKNLETLFNNASNLLLEWYSNHTKRIEIDEGFLDHYWNSNLSSIRDRLYKNQQQELWQSLLQLVNRRLLGKTLCLLPNHGDFWLNNILIQKDNSIAGVIDWDSYILEGLPLQDLFHLMSWRSQRLYGDLSFHKFSHFTMNSRSYRKRIAVQHCEYLDIDPALIIDLFCRYWLEHIERRVDEFKSNSTIVNQINQVIKILR